MATNEEVPLLGGMSTAGVVRVGDTVRRPMGRNADYVHRLLLHFEQCGFEGAPRYLGVDQKNREILSFIDGVAAPHNGFELTAQAVPAGARLVRDRHDLTQGSPFAAGAQAAAHRNLSQPNFVFRDMIPVAIIDWDSTRPGTRVENLGEFLWAFVHPAIYGDGEPAARMLAAAVDAYGRHEAGVAEAMLEHVRRFVLDDPDPGNWSLRELDYMERNAPLFTATLLSEGLPRTAGRLERRRNRRPPAPAPGRAGTARPNA